MYRLYLAAPLFSEAELAFNRALRDLLKEYFDVFLPQEDSGLMVEMVRRGMPLDTAKRVVFRDDTEAVRRSDFLLIVLDGRAVDEGACFELGFARALGKKCVGYQSDPRRLLPMGNNPMLECALQLILKSREELVEWAAREGNGAPVQELCGTDVGHGS